jgi:hypothetical protein
VLIRYPLLMIAALNFERDHLDISAAEHAGAMRQFLK